MVGGADFMQFDGVEQLVGAAGNEDTFVFGPAGNIVGGIVGATLTASGNVSIAARNQGDRGDLSDDNKIVVNIAIDRASATVEDPMIDASGLTLTAESAANYSIKGSKAINLIDGFTKAVIDPSAVNVLAGGAVISATETSTISAESSGNGGLAAAVKPTRLPHVPMMRYDRSPTCRVSTTKDSGRVPFQ